MIEDFLKSMTELYSLILQPIDILYKKIAITNYKDALGIDKNISFGEKYYELKISKKANGAVYTPRLIAEYIIKNTISDDDIISNPYLKILDPACGVGNLIIPCFNYLKHIFLCNLQQINIKNGLKLTQNDISKHIIKNNIYAFDIDEIALKILTIDVFDLCNYVSKNFILRNFLISKSDNKYDIIIGNPPYIGHKSMDREYTDILKKLYKNVYKDKGDISYCFFEKSINDLKINGKLTFITSRYFIESPSGENLRNLLSQNTVINKIIDFYGIRPFKGIGIDPVIIFLKNKKIFNYEVKVVRPLNNEYKNKETFFKSLFLDDGNESKNFFIKSSLLKNKVWILVNGQERNILNKISSKTLYTLKDISKSYQGIITGCDRAFVVSMEDIKKDDLEISIIKPWIKSSSIQKDKVIREDKFLIYTDFIEDEKKYPNTIKHIVNYKNKLMNRRECKKGIRKWYQLQWGRISNIFDGKKIIFPYKSSSNRFALDYGSYFSADVYALVLNDDSNIKYKYLLSLLNSKLYEFYFKTFAKKLGENFFEYYPNTVMKLRIPIIEDVDEVNDEILNSYFGITSEEKEIIDSYTDNRNS